MMRVLGVIQCRFSSARLPGKALRDLAGRPVLAWVIARMRRAREVNELVLATSSQPTDDPIAELGSEGGLAVVRGALDDVLTRYGQVLVAHPAEIVVRITADNPLTDPETLDRGIRWFQAGGFDHGWTKDPPYGAGADLFRAQALAVARTEATEPAHREHINQFFLAHPQRFRLGAMELPVAQARPDVRVTLDTPDDLERLQALFARLADPEAADLAQMIAAYDSLPGALRHRAA